MIAQILISQNAIPFIIFALSVIVAIMGYFLKRTIDEASTAKEKADRAFQEIIILDNRVDGRQKAIDEKLERTLSSLNDSVEKLTEAIKPMTLVIYRLERLEENLKDLSKE